MPKYPSPALNTQQTYSLQRTHPQNQSRQRPRVFALSTQNQNDAIHYPDSNQMLARQTFKEIRKSKKRIDSDCNQKSLFNCYSTVKQLTEQDQEKLIRIKAKFHLNFSISNRFPSKQCDYRSELSNNIQIEINQQCLARIKRRLPMIEQVRRKVSLLNESIILEKTIRSILDQLKKDRKLFRSLQSRIVKNLTGTYCKKLWSNLQKLKPQKWIVHLTSSRSITRRQKILKKKDIVLDFLKIIENQLLLLHKATIKSISQYHKIISLRMDQKQTENDTQRSLTRPFPTRFIEEQADSIQRGSTI